MKKLNRIHQYLIKVLKKKVQKLMIFLFVLIIQNLGLANLKKNQKIGNQIMVWWKKQ